MFTADADIHVDMGNGEVLKINLIQMLVATQNAEFKRDHGCFLPGVGKLGITLAEYRRRFGLAPEWSKTWAQTADTMRELYEDFSAQHREFLASL